MTEKLLTGTLSLNTNKQNQTIAMTSECAIHVIQAYRAEISVREGLIFQSSVSAKRTPTFYGTLKYITKTRPCNIQRIFSAVKIENFVGEILIFLIF